MSCCGGGSNNDKGRLRPHAAHEQAGPRVTSSAGEKKPAPNGELMIKLLLLGDSGVGKTCLLLRYSDDMYTDTFISTIGIDFKHKTIELEGRKVKLQIWDTAGQEKYRTITTAYYRSAQGILLCYDCTDEKSFQNITNWARNIEEHASGSVNRILIATKCDQDSKRVIPAEKGKALAEKYGIPFLETSAKTNANVSEAFLALATAVKERLDKAMST